MPDQTYGYDPAPGEVAVPVKLTLKREQEFEFMPDQTYAARLRERVATERRADRWSDAYRWVELPVDEADAIADALEAAVELNRYVTASNRPESRNDFPGTWAVAHMHMLDAQQRFLAKFAALDRRAGREEQG